MYSAFTIANDTGHSTATATTNTDTIALANTNTISNMNSIFLHADSIINKW